RRHDGAAAVVGRLDCERADERCAAATKTLRSAARVVQSALRLNRNVNVHATFRRFNSSDPAEKDALAYASPAGVQFVEDTDGVIRLYPLSLLKQLQLGSIEYDEHLTDIFVAIDASSWAPRDAGDGEVVTPLVVLTEDGSFHGFFGTAIGKAPGFGYPSGQPNSVRIERMNNFRLPGKGHTVDDVVRLFSNSSEFRYARELEEMAVKPHTLALRPVSVAPQDDIWPGGGKLWLETSLPRFAKGRTLSHVSTADYRATADCLSEWRQIPDRESAGAPVSDGPVNMTEEVVSNARAADPAVPQLIGPGLLSVLEEMGYATMRQPVPVYRPLREQIPRRRDAGGVGDILRNIRGGRHLAELLALPAQYVEGRRRRAAGAAGRVCRLNVRAPPRTPPPPPPPPAPDRSVPIARRPPSGLGRTAGHTSPPLLVTGVANHVEDLFPSPTYENIGQHTFWLAMYQ
ncbi:MAG: hypothetical protein BJ554DRAFT_2161, partial [Olpidium bornovanus]